MKRMLVAGLLIGSLAGCVSPLDPELVRQQTLANTNSELNAQVDKQVASMTPTDLIPRDPTPLEMDAIRKSVSRNLLDPGSLQFRDIQVNGAGNYCGFGNAKNKFGGYVGFRIFSGSLLPSVSDAAHPPYAMLNAPMNSPISPYETLTVCQKYGLLKGMSL